MNHRIRRMLFSMAIRTWAVFAIGGICGCASTAMKGTPFYTGEYEKRLGPAEDRVNLWPLLYYRDPAFSILWPMVELTDKHFALRPLMSIEGVGGSNRIYNVMWPIARFNSGGNSRVFPAFWGRDYAVILPVYWHFGAPLDGDGYDGLIPLWSFSNRKDGYSTWLMWPVFHVQDKSTRKGWHVWPVAGSYWNAKDSYSFALWPLGHSWSGDKGAEAGSTLLPLYWYDRDPGGKKFLSLPISFGSRADGTGWQLMPPLFWHSAGRDGSTFLSLPYSRASDAQAGTEWSLLMPLFYSSKTRDGSTFATLAGGVSRKGDATSWVVVPLLSGGRTSKNASEFWIGGPLVHHSREADTLSQHVFPFYYRSSDNDGSLFLSIPWSQGSSADGSSWSLLPPLLYKASDNSGRILISPIFSSGASAAGKKKWHTTLPLYYRSCDEQGSLFLSVPWSQGSSADGSSWSLLPPLLYRTSDNSGRTLISPLFSSGASADGKEKWHTVPPLYYKSESEKESTFATLAGGWRTDKEGRRWLIYPLLSGGRRGEDAGEVWLAAPVFHAEWDKEGSSHFLLPLYYRNGRSGTFVSPLAAQWAGQDGRKWTAVPPALSLYSSGAKASDLWSIGGLAHFSWGKEAGSQHVLPLFYANGRSGTFVSPVAARWRNDSSDTTTWMLPPALSWISSSGKRKDAWILGPVAHASWGEKAGSQHLLPVFYRNREKGTFLSVPYCNWDENGTRNHLSIPLMTFYSNDGINKDLYSMLGLFRHAWGNDPTEGHFLPLYTFGQDHFLSPLFGWDSSRDEGYFYPLTPIFGARTGQNRSGSWVFPLYSYERSKLNGDVAGMFLWGSYWKRAASSGSGMFPLYGYSRDTDNATGSQHTRFWSLPACWYQKRMVKEPVRTAAGATQQVIMKETKHGFFPLWRSKTRVSEGSDRISKSTSVLWLLFDYERIVKPCPDDKTDDYRRTRVLWRLWHGERSNGEVSVDVFPAITYDSKPDGYKKMSFLWRLFSYERNKEGSRLHLLYLPVYRSKAEVAGTTKN